MFDNETIHRVAALPICQIDVAGIRFIPLNEEWSVRINLRQ